MNYECLACGAKFNEMDQTNYEYKNGQCPCCGNYDTKPVDFLYEKELADLIAMREANPV